jgi:hypothetical protein
MFELRDHKGAIVSVHSELDACIEDGLLRAALSDTLFFAYDEAGDLRATISVKRCEDNTRMVTIDEPRLPRKKAYMMLDLILLALALGTIADVLLRR